MLTAGQHQAISELKAVERRTDGRVQAGAVRDEPTATNATIEVSLVVDCRGTPVVPPHGVNLGETQTFTVFIPPDYPYSHPYVETTHDRFGGLPHVLWQNGICLYTSPNDWEPSAGMLGFIRRLLTWLARAAGGSLIGPALPWHPPVGATLSGMPPLVIAVDLPPAFEADQALWTCWATITDAGANHLQLRGWHSELPEPTEDALVVPVIGLPHAVGFLFPEFVGDLVRLLASQGLDPHDFRSQIRQTWNANGGTAQMVLVGSPAPPAATSRTRIATIAAWWLSVDQADEIGIGDELDHMRALWSKVYDQRPSAVTRRDASRPVNWLVGKRVLILGCGALGAPIAEHCVRAGVTDLRLIDGGVVSPGILVRQPFRNNDIGAAKAIVIADRLREIAPNAAVTADCLDATTLTHSDLIGVDLLVDATANRAVAESLEALRRTGQGPRPTAVAVMVGHDCERAVATIALSASTGGGVDIQRRLAMAAFDNADLADLREDFYPSYPRTEVFQPEPGCSDPTYVGSAADLADFAARLLNAALTFVRASEPDTATTAAASAASNAAVVIRRWNGVEPEAAPRLLQWTNDVVLHDETSGYEIRVAPRAWASMRSEAVRATQLERGPREAGGLLLGQFDPACHVVWVSEALAAASDGDASAGHVRVQVDKIRDRLMALSRRTKGVLGFVGAWHNHPWGPALPSGRDHDTMTGIVNTPDGTIPVALLMILGGADDVWNNWLNGTGRPDAYAELYFTETKRGAP